MSSSNDSSDHEIGLLTLPSITATHELVVPKSIPITSLPVANLDALPLQIKKPKQLKKSPLHGNKQSFLFRVDFQMSSGPLT
jgi:hypothetical protein